MEMKTYDIVLSHFYRQAKINKTHTHTKSYPSISASKDQFPILNSHRAHLYNR